MKKNVPKNAKRFMPYSFVVTIPDRMYPFASYIDGERVRWRRSYEYTLSQIQKKLGEGRYGSRLIAYRAACHVVGAGLFIIAATLISHAIWGTNGALPALFLAAMTIITYQEFILQPRTYNQHLTKGILDWASWAVPIGVYVVYFVK